VNGKARIRTEVRKTIARMTDAQRLAEEQAVADAVTATDAWRSATAVLLYAALPDEVSLLNVEEAARSHGKSVFLPRVREQTLTFHETVPEQTDLERHRFGMLEPPASARQFAPSDQPWLLICPGRAFDRQGNRLGRGGGYYDRFLASRKVKTHPPVLVIGVCYRGQLRYSLPTDAHDQRMEMIVAGDVTFMAPPSED
jgi:5-formyltetrahydrofolate cyclo-ligase